MVKYIIKRIAIALLVLLGITVIDFALMQMIGNPMEIMAGGPRVSKEVLAVRAQQMGLDKPVWQQYFSWLGQVLQGNFGYSYKNHQPVWDQIVSHLQPTLILMTSALLLSLVIAVTAGIYSAVHQHEKGDYLIVTLAFLGQSVPQFFMALLLIWVFAVKLGWLPSGGMRQLGSSDSSFSFRYLLLPMTVLAVEMAGRNIRYIRSSMLEILNRDYLKTAKGRGIGRFLLIYKHGLRNALIPIITVIGMEIPVLFGGSIIIEQVFSWPGLGLLTMDAVLSRDYAMIMAVALLSAVVVLTANLLTDILYALADPTVRYQ
ncbi:MAG: ABC transporter permease [Lachnospiraceae bacterium]|nr:ABC transporter permease [Lachnospiraceae bacterium]